MAQSSWPFENIDTNETQFSQWARNIGEGVKTGALNELEVFADSTGMQVKVRSGQALVRGHYYQNTAELALSLDAADLTNPRIDTVVLELDPSANSIVLKVITGTPAPSPSAEPVVQTDAGIYQIKLADIAVGASVTTISAGNVTDTRGYIEDFEGTVPGSAITGEITTATMDGDRLFNAIDSATINATNVTNTVSTQAGTTYSTVSGDAGKVLRFTDATGVTVTVDDLLSVGERIDIYQKGAGVVTFTAGSGVTLEGAGSTGVNLAITTQFGAATILCESAGVYAIIGSIGAA